MSLDDFSAHGVFISVRVWTPGAENRPDDPAATPPAVCLVHDLSLASGGTPAVSVGQVHMTQFRGIHSACLFARRVQWAIQGLAEGSAHPPASAILLQSVQDTSGPIEDGSSFPILEQASPGQILLAEAAAKALDDLPGLEPQRNGGAGLAELPWRDTHVIPARDTDDLELTRLIDANGRGEDQAVEEFPPLPLPVQMGSESHAVGPHAGRSPMLLWGGIAAAVLAVAAGSYFLFERSHSEGAPGSEIAANAPATPATAAPVAAQPQSTANAPATRAPAAPVTTQPQSTAKSPPRQSAAQSRPSKPVVVRPQPPPEPSKPAPVATDKKEELPAGRGCAIGIDQIPDELAQGEHSLGRGRYDDAIRQFQAVLDCESGNAQAHAGLERARAAKAAEGNP
ncbi:MAG: hypothetical protein ABSA85_12995 [Terracidiphilus sp.]|jgi:hypothetical protein